MPDERGITRLLCGSAHVREESSDDDAIACLATKQRAVAGRAQLLDLGISPDAIGYRLRVGRLRVLFPGVYAVGHEAIDYPGHALAAVMSLSEAGSRTVVAASDLTALVLWNLVESGSGLITVTVTQPRRPRRGIAIRRAVLPEEDVECQLGFPRTTVARTLLDASARWETGALRRLVKRAEAEKLITLDELAAILDRYPRRPGRRRLARLADSRTVRAGRTRSELEDRFSEFCAARGLPMPETNVLLEVRGKLLEVDCLWRKARLVVELDGYEAHGTKSAFQDDRARDRALVAAGFAPMRVTWAQLDRDADALEAEIRAVLTARSRTNVG